MRNYIVARKDGDADLGLKVLAGPDSQVGVNGDSPLIAIPLRLYSKILKERQEKHVRTSKDKEL